MGACGSGSPTPISSPPIATTTTTPKAAPPTPDAAPPDAAAPIAIPTPKLACDPGATATAAPDYEPTWFCARADGTRDGAFVTLYPDGAIAVTGAYKNGKLSGPWQRRFHDGTPAEVGQYSEGQKDGHWKQLAPSGAVLGEYDLATGTGTEKRWYDSGPLYSERALVGGVPHGPSKQYALDGTVWLSARYYKGKLDGARSAGSKNLLRIEEEFSGGTRVGKRSIWQFWTLIVEEQYDGAGRFHGPYVAWRDKKVARYQGEYEHGRKIGTWVWNDRANNKEREGAYVKGKRDGVWNEWYEKKLTFTGTYTAGRPDGTFIYYDRNNNELGRFDIADGTGTMLTYYGNRKVATKEHVVKGERDGRYQELSMKGKAVVDGYYGGGVRWGDWREYTADGVLLLDERYKRNRVDGAVKKFVDGKPSLVATYKDGKAEGEYLELRPDGKPAVKGQFVGDRKVGTWTYYDASGAVTLTSTYDPTGVLVGPYKQTFPDGSVLEGVMANGRRAGTWTRTDRSGTVTRTTYSTP